MADIHTYSQEDDQFTVASITRVGATVTLTTQVPHNIQTAEDAIISGSDQPEYNGTFTITATGPFTLEYTIVGTPVTPATGNIVINTGRFALVLTEPAYQQTPVLGVTSITRSGSTATATTNVDHNYETGDFATLVGADQSEYNGDYVITVTGSNTFEYTIVGTPVTPATGTITCFVNLVPPLATTITPPTPGPGQTPVFELATTTWTLKDDLLNTVYYIPPDYEEYTLDSYGPLPLTAVTSIPLATLKERKIDETYAQFLFQSSQKELTISPGVVVNGSSSEQNAYEITRDNFGSLPGTPREYVVSTRSFVDSSIPIYNTIILAWAERRELNMDNFESLVNQINAAPDESTLDAIDITTGWVP